MFAPGRGILAYSRRKMKFPFKDWQEFLKQAANNAEEKYILAAKEQRIKETDFKKTVWRGLFAVNYAKLKIDEMKNFLTRLYLYWS